MLPYLDALVLRLNNQTNIIPNIVISTIIINNKGRITPTNAPTLTYALCDDDDDPIGMLVLTMEDNAWT